MRNFIKTVSFLLGLTAVGAVVWLGYETANNQSPQLVAVFGVASAIIAPIGFAMIGYAFKSNEQEVINRLAKVPEIEKLIIEARTQEEKIRLLEKQKQQLADIVLFETRKQSLITQKKSLENEAVRILDELRAIDIELSTLRITVAENKEIVEELNSLRERVTARQRGDIVFSLGRRSYVLESSGRRDTLLHPTPLRTGRAPLNAPGSSKPRASQFQLLISGFYPSLGFAAGFLLMAIEV